MRWPSISTGVGCQIGSARQLGKHWSVMRHEWLRRRKCGCGPEDHCLTDCSTLNGPKYLHVSLLQGNGALGVGLQLEQDRIPHHEHALKQLRSALRRMRDWPQSSWVCCTQSVSSIADVEAVGQERGGTKVGFLPVEHLEGRPTERRVKCGVVPKLRHRKPAPPFARSVVVVAAKEIKALVYALTLTICLWMIHYGLPQLGANGGEHLSPHVAGEDAVTVGRPRTPAPLVH